jgi:hypothetical protein
MSAKAQTRIRGVLHYSELSRRLRRSETLRRVFTVQAAIEISQLEAAARGGAA